jgi:hypothetical protein
VSQPLLARGLVPAQWRPAAAAGPAAWLDVVSDERHQAVLSRHSAHRPPCAVALRTEMQGRRRGAAVTVEGDVVGHLSQPFARRWHPWVLAAEVVGQHLTGTATVLPGTREDPAFRVFARVVWPGDDVAPGR